MRLSMLLAVAVVLAVCAMPQPMSAKSMDNLSGACKCNGPQWPACPYVFTQTDCPGTHGTCPEDKAGANRCKPPVAACSEKLDPGGNAKCPRADTIPCL